MLLRTAGLTHLRDMLPLAERVAAAGFEVIVPSLPGVAFSEARMIKSEACAI